MGDSKNPRKTKKTNAKHLATACELLHFVKKVPLPKKNNISVFEDEDDGIPAVVQGTDCRTARKGKIQITQLLKGLRVCKEEAWALRLQKARGL
mmetsp:Transcript_1334/g.2530  ORF Transcript_1334/g.2530 Transcript_1334/m.2530 type:complete len:94 (-) Transcript_1334:1511-1792(-)